MADKNQSEQHAAQRQKELLAEALGRAREEGGFLLNQAGKTASAGKVAYEQSKDRERELRKLRGNVEKIEKEISILEAQIADKEAILSSGTAQDPDFFAQYQQLKDQLDQKMDAWEQATVALDAAEN